MRKHKDLGQVNIAKERIKLLFSEAKKNAAKHPARANRYIFLARKLAMRYNLRMSSEQRREYCHKCYHYLLPGKNCTVRTNSKTKCVEYLCADCKHINRYGYGNKN